MDPISILKSFPVKFSKLEDVRAGHFKRLDELMLRDKELESQLQRAVQSAEDPRPVLRAMADTLSECGSTLTRISQWASASASLFQDIAKAVKKTIK